jgi:hypothetical protein
LPKVLKLVRKEIFPISLSLQNGRKNNVFSGEYAKS